MKPTTSVAVAILVLAILTFGAQSPPQHTHYKLIDLGTFGGTTSYLQFCPAYSSACGGAIGNDRGNVVGYAETAVTDPFPSFCFTGDCVVAHAFESRRGALTDLGALTNGVSSAALAISPNGLIAGVSENGATDPLYTGLPVNHAILWQNGKINDLGTLPAGGFESYANAVNDFGQVVGAALNTTADMNSMQSGIFWFFAGISPVYPSESRAFLWDKQNGMQDLGTLSGGTDAQALFINDRGQVVGWSYEGSTQTTACNFPIATGSFIWDKEHGMVDLGGFGGTCTLATELNDQGQIIGVSNLTGDQISHAFIWHQGKLSDLGTLGGNTASPNFINNAGDVVGKADLPGVNSQDHHAILWKNGAKFDLGILPGDSCSSAYYVNSLGQIVGNSESESLCFVSGEHAFLWENGGPMIDLNSLIPANSGLQLTHALVITDKGEIAGLGVPPGCPPDQDVVCGHAFILIPRDAGLAENAPE